MGSSEVREDETPTSSTDSASKADSDRLARPGDTSGQAGDDDLSGGQEDDKAGTPRESVGELEQAIPRLEDASARIWRAGSLQSGDNILSGTRRPLIRLAEILADGHYFLTHKRLRTPRLDYIKRSLMASLKVSYGLTRELERQIDITRKHSSKYASADDVVPPRARSWKARRQKTRRWMQD